MMPLYCNKLPDLPSVSDKVSVSELRIDTSCKCPTCSSTATSCCPRDWKHFTPRIYKASYSSTSSAIFKLPQPCRSLKVSPKLTSFLETQPTSTISEELSFNSRPQNIARCLPCCSPETTLTPKGVFMSARPCFPLTPTYVTFDVGHRVW